MKAILYHSFGDPSVLQYTDAAKPVPGTGELLIRVHATSLNPKDVLLRKGKMQSWGPPGWPKTSGHDFAGIVEAVGSRVRDYAPGDRVYGMWNGRRMACAAEYVVFPTSSIARMPAKASFAEAAAVPLAAQTALQAVRDLGGVRTDARVLINGASGGVGTFAVSIAKILGATVTTLTSAANHPLMKQLGADDCWDYRDPAWRQRAERFDVFFDVFGNQSFAGVKQLLTPHARYITTIPSARAIARHFMTRFSPGRRDLLVLVRSRARDLEQLARWIDSGQLRVIVDRTWPLAEAAQAHAYLETKRARGKVVLTIA